MAFYSLTSQASPGFILPCPGMTHSSSLLCPFSAGEGKRAGTEGFMASLGPGVRFSVIYGQSLYFKKTVPGGDFPVEPSWWCGCHLRNSLMFRACRCALSASQSKCISNSCFLTNLQSLLYRASQEKVVFLDCYASPVFRPCFGVAFAALSIQLYCLQLRICLNFSDF